MVFLNKTGYHYYCRHISVNSGLNFNVTTTFQLTDAVLKLCVKIIKSNQTLNNFSLFQTEHILDVDYKRGKILTKVLFGAYLNNISLGKLFL